MKKIINTKKRFLALAFVCVIAVSAIAMDLFHVDAAQEYILSDNFSDSSHTREMWTSGLNSKIQNETVVLSGVTDTFLISDKMWDKGNKPTKFSFTAYTSTHPGKWPDGGLRVQLLHTESANLEFSINTAQTQGFHKYIATGFTSNRGDAIRLFNAADAGSNQTTPFTYTFTYDWSRWDEVAEGEQPRVTITLEALLRNKKKYTDTITFVCTEKDKPDTFNVGFKSEKETSVIDDVSLEFKLSETKLKENLETTYHAFEQDKTYAKANEYLKLYQMLAATSKQEVSESYTAVSNWLKSRVGAFTDDFSNRDKTGTLWAGGLEEFITADETAVLSGETDTYLISDAMWDAGNKPTKLSFKVYTSEIVKAGTYPDGGLEVQLLHSDNATLKLSLNTAQQYYFHKYSTSGFDGTGANGTTTTGRLWQTALGRASNTDTPIEYTITYDWSKWDEVAKGSSPQVTVNFVMINSKENKKLEYSQTFTYSKNNKPETFKVGFANKKLTQVIDDVSIEFKVSEAKLKQQLQKKYTLFQAEKTYTTAREYLESYKLLTAISQKEFAESYVAVCDWLKAQPGSLMDDFGSSDKTGVLWSNGLYEKVTDDETAALFGDTDTYLISDEMWDKGNKPVKFSFTTYTSTYAGGYPDDGLRVQLLYSENVHLEFRINTAQWGGYHKYYTTGLKADRDNLRLWQPATELGSNQDTPIAYTFTFDWSEWEKEGKVTVIADAIGTNGNKMSTQAITFTCTETKKPDTFKVGFKNQKESAVIDNVQVSCKFEPVMLGAEAVVNQDNRLNIKVRSDFSIIDGITTMNGATLKEFGVVLIPGSLTGETMQKKVREMIEADLQKDEKTGAVRQGLSEQPKNWTGIINVTVDNSGEEDTLGKRLTAMAYMVFEKNGQMQYYYSTNSNEMVKNGALNMSVIGVLKKALEENTDAERERALNSYNEGNHKSESLDSLKALLSGQDTTTKAQKELLQYVFKYLSE